MKRIVTVKKNIFRMMLKRAAEQSRSFLIWSHHSWYGPDIGKTCTPMAFAVGLIGVTVHSGRLKTDLYQYVYSFIFVCWLAMLLTSIFIQKIGYFWRYMRRNMLTKCTVLWYTFPVGILDGCFCEWHCWVGVIPLAIGWVRRNGSPENKCSFLEAGQQKTIAWR